MYILDNDLDLIEKLIEKLIEIWEIISILTMLDIVRSEPWQSAIHWIKLNGLHIELKALNI